MPQKVCPVVFRLVDGDAQLLSFRHPSAGNQFVKGTVKEGELASEAAIRELEEESGIATHLILVELGRAPIGKRGTIWHFFGAEVEGLPERWEHQTRDDFGHVFSFFWHPLSSDLDENWHPDFHEALRVIRRSVPL